MPRRSRTTAGRTSRHETVCILAAIAVLLGGCAAPGHGSAAEMEGEEATGDSRVEVAPGNAVEGKSR